MTVIEVINLGCAIVSASAEAAPLIKKWKSKKDARRMAVKKPYRRPQPSAQEESDRDNTRLGPRSSIEAEIGSGNFEDLIQAQVVSTLQLILKEGSINNDRFDGMSVDSKTQPVSILVDQVRRMPFEAPTRAFSFPTPNCPQQGGLEGPSSRASSFSMLEPSRRTPIGTPPMRAFSFPTSNQYCRESLDSPLRPSSFSLRNPSQPMSPETPLPRASSFPLPNLSQPMSPETPLVRPFSFPLPNEGGHKSPKFRPRASSIPMPDQWRRSLKLPPSALSSPTVSEANTIASPHPPAGSFHDILGLGLLHQLLPYLNNVPIQHLIHHAAAWSYSQTLDQLLYPDHFYLKGDAVMMRSYLSSSVRSHIWFFAYTLSESSPQGQALTLAIFLNRFIMQYGTHVLLDAPRQYEDPTGLRELETRYDIAREILRFLEAEE